MEQIGRSEGGYSHGVASAPPRSARAQPRMLPTPEAPSEAGCRSKLALKAHPPTEAPTEAPTKAPTEAPTCQAVIPMQLVGAQEVDPDLPVLGLQLLMPPLDLGCRTAQQRGTAVHMGGWVPAGGQLCTATAAAAARAWAQAGQAKPPRSRAGRCQAHVSTTASCMVETEGTERTHGPVDSQMSRATLASPGNGTSSRVPRLVSTATGMERSAVITAAAVSKGCSCSNSQGGGEEPSVAATGRTLEDSMFRKPPKPPGRCCKYYTLQIWRSRNIFGRRRTTAHLQSMPISSTSGT